MVGSSGLNVGEDADVVEIAVEAFGGLAEQRLRCDSRVARCWNGTWVSLAFSYFIPEAKVFT